VVERGKRWIKHQHPGDPNRFMLDTHIGPIHYGASEDQEIDTAWVASAGAWDWEVVKNDFECYVRDSVPVGYRYLDVVTGEDVELEVDAIEWVNDSDQRENITSFSQVTPSINDDSITWPDISTGWNVTVQAQTARLAKKIVIDSLANLGSPTLTGTVDFAMSFRFQKTAGLDIYVDGLLWNENAETATSNHIEFRAGATSVFWFKRPWAADSDIGSFNGSMVVRKQGANLFVEVRIPWAWLQAASYPIEIDPTVEPLVSQSSDDAYQEDTGTNPVITAQNAFIGSPSGGGVHIYAGFRWNVTGVGQADTIDVAYVEVRSTTTDDPDVDIDFEDADDPGTFTTDANNISGRTLTGNAVTWTETDAGSEQMIDSPSLIVPVQAVVDRGGWAAGQDMVCVFMGRSTQTVQIRFYDENTAYAAKLHIEYSTGGGTVGRMYSVNAAVASVTTAIDLMRISAPTDAVVVVHKVLVTQETEFADAQSEQLDILFHRGSTDGSGGAAATISPLEVGDAAFGGTAVAGNTTQSTEGAILHREAWAVAAGFVWAATPEERFVLSPSGRGVVELTTAPDDSVDFRVTVYIEEIGG
jgi:hypothetical protein